MIKIIKEKSEITEFLRSFKSRQESDASSAEKTVEEIISDVEKNGDAALRKYSEKFDEAALKEFEYSKERREKRAKEAPCELVAVMKRASENIKNFHEKQKSAGFDFSPSEGIKTGIRVLPLKRVGMYVPGGTASYPSSVLMNAIPAKVAGVSELIMVTPPDKNGEISPNLIAAAEIAGVDRIFALGGAQAIAALACGTESVPKVDKIVGPGNIFVATAKKTVFGKCDIDMIAGPSEILIIADNQARADYVAADMLSQAEHDKLASAILICFDETFAKNVSEELEIMIKKLPRNDIMRESVDNHSAIIICGSSDEAVDLSNEIAPEHLEIACADAEKILEKAVNAGSVFLGNYTPEPMGDYYAGPNHVLPTGGSAKFFSPLCVESFLKRQSYLCYSKEAALKAADDVIAFAEAEGLFAHANSMKIRKESDK